MKPAYEQQRYSVGTVSVWLHHLHRSIAVRSDAWVMVQVSHNRLALLYSTKRMVSPNFLRSMIFYIMMYHFVRIYREKFGIHVNTQTVVTLLDIGMCTTCLRMYPLRTIHTLRRCKDSIGSIILVHTIVVLQIGTASSGCLLP